MFEGPWVVDMVGVTVASPEPDKLVKAKAASESPLPGLEFRNVSVTFGDGPRQRSVLSQISLNIGEGEFVSIIGKSGTGKTTLLRVAAGLLDPADGHVVIRGQKVDGPQPEVAFVFQDYAASMLPWRTVERNVSLGLEGKVSKDERRYRVTTALEMARVADRANDYPWQLSGGMQQRVQLARALAMQPNVMLMDEPLGSLDAMTKAQLQDELQGVHQLTGVLVVFITHDIDEAVYLSDRIVVLTGSPARVTKQFDVQLPRPRDQISTKESEEYLQIRHAVHMALRETQSENPSQET